MKRMRAACGFHAGGTRSHRSTRLGDRNGEAECCPRALCALNSDRAPMSLHDLLHDGQSEALPFFLRIRIRDELVEHFLQQFLGNASAIVSHHTNYCAAFVSGADL